MDGPGVSPLPELRTERLLLRAYTDADAPRVLDIHSRIEVVRWLDNPPHVLQESLDDARAWIARQHAKHERDPRCGGWAIEVVATGVVAGTALVSPVTDGLPGADDLETGWHLHPDSAGHGYATEAARAVVDHTLASGVERLWCVMYPDNDASAGVARRLGLTELGVRPDPWYGDESLMFTAGRSPEDVPVR